MNRFNLCKTLVLALGIVAITAGCKGIVKEPHDDHERRMRNAIRINPDHELGNRIYEPNLGFKRILEFLLKNLDIINDRNRDLLQCNQIFMHFQMKLTSSFCKSNGFPTVIHNP